MHAERVPRTPRETAQSPVRPFGISGLHRILSLGAHPDDVELGCGGALAVAGTAGVELHSAVMSNCADESPKERKTLRIDEFLRACDVLKAKPHTFDVPNRELPEHRGEIMRVLEGLQDQVRPDLVFIPYRGDPHQDHATVAEAAVRTFRRNETILEYEILRYGSHSFTPSLFVDITNALDTKLRSLRCYESQAKARAYFDEQSFRSLARTRGAQSGYEYAEGFVIYKMFW